MAGGPQAKSFKGFTLSPAELEALVCKEAQCVLQAREQEEVEEVDQAQAAQVAEPWGEWAVRACSSPQGGPTLVRGHALLSPEGGSWPRATAEKRSRARGLSRSVAARNPRVTEGAWRGQNWRGLLGAAGPPPAVWGQA